MGVRPYRLRIHKFYVLQSILYLMGKSSLAEVEKSSVVTIRLSKRNLQRVEAVRALEEIDRSTLFKKFIEDGLRDRVLLLYKKGKLSGGRAAEILGISLREFLELLERECIPINWDSEGVKQYLKQKYGE